MNEKLETYSLAAVGLVKGVFEVYVRPIPGDMFKWAAGRLIQFEMPTQEEVDAHIAEVSNL